MKITLVLVSMRLIKCFDEIVRKLSGRRIAPIEQHILVSHDFGFWRFLADISKNLRFWIGLGFSKSRNFGGAALGRAKEVSTLLIITIFSEHRAEPRLV
jgi:hypothetical protein